MQLWPWTLLHCGYTNSTLICIIIITAEYITYMMCARIEVSHVIYHT